MSIVFNPPVDVDNIHLAYNNDIYNFYPDSGTPIYADVIIANTNINIRLYPNPSGEFYLNLMPYVSAYINQRNFADTLETDIVSTDPTTFMYNHSYGTYFSGNVNIIIRLNDKSTLETQFNIRWLAGVQQIGNYIPLHKEVIHILTPLDKDNANKVFLKYWQGYPFDIGFYIPFKTSLHIKNYTNTLSYTFGGGNIAAQLIRRLFFSDGRTDETLEDVLPLVEGYNNLNVRHYDGFGEIFGSIGKYITLVKEPYTCGVYFKWLNQYGAYSYWLFDDTAAIDRSTKAIGEIANDFKNLNQTLGRANNIGQQVTDKIKVSAGPLSEQECILLEGIISSPKIYMFTGQPYARNSYTDWVEVTLSSSSARIKNFKEKQKVFSFDFELPQNYTQTL